MISRGRGRLVTGVVVSVAAAYVGVGLSLISNTSTAATVGIGVVISGIGIVIGLLIELHAVLSGEVTIRVIQGQGALMKEYEEMRRTRGALRIQAIWSARYPSTELDAYFVAEAADLRRTKSLTIERLVADDVADKDARDVLIENATALPNLKIWAIEPVVLECNLCEYVANRTTYVRALVVLGGADKGAQVAISLDTRDEPAMEGVVFGLKRWWESLTRRELAT
jgi:hypothetical protein